MRCKTTVCDVVHGASIDSAIAWRILNIEKTFFVFRYKILSSKAPPYLFSRVGYSTDAHIRYKDLNDIT